MKKRNVFDYVKSINDKKYIWDNFSDKEFDPYIINLAFSYYLDTLFFANEMNKYPKLSNKQIYDFLYFGISKRKRWANWNKQDKNKQEIIRKLSEFYNISENEMSNIIRIIGDDKAKALIKKVIK